MNETPTAPGTAKDAGKEAGEPVKKSVWKSRTIWLNLVAMLSALLPQVQEWLAENPVEIVSAFAAVNVLVRFVTSGKVSIFGASKAASLCLMGLTGLAAIALTSCAGSTARFEVMSDGTVVPSLTLPVEGGGTVVIEVAK